MFRNIGFNFIGMALPLVAAFLCIPKLITSLGVEAFGVLTIVWMLIGYFSVFDLGLGRALTQAVSRLIGRGEVAKVGPTVAVAQRFMLLLGLLGALVVFIFASAITENLLRVSPDLHETTLNSLYLLGSTIPLVIQATGAKGVLESLGRFGVISAIRAPIGAWTFAGPVIALQFSNRLDTIVGFLVAGRIVNYLCFRYAMTSALRDGGYKLGGPRPPLKPLLSFGGWLTVSNLVSPVMVYMDRFFISAILGAGVVAYYTTPYEAVFKIGVIPEAAFGVLFPMLAASLAAKRYGAGRILAVGNGLVLAFVFPVVALVAYGAPFILRHWLGPEFEQESALIMQVLAVGLFVNSFSKNVLNMVQASGRPDLSAKIHLFELPLYVLMLYLALSAWGVEGAAFAWLARMVLDLVCLSAAARMVERSASKPVLVTLSLATFFSISLASVVALGVTPAAIYVFVGLVLSAVAIGLRTLWRSRAQAAPRAPDVGLEGRPC